MRSVAGLQASGVVPLLGLAGSLSLTACRGPTPPTLRVAFSSCRTVSAGPVCALDRQHPLRLWVEAPPGAALEIRPAPDGPGRAVAGGRLFDLPSAGGAAEVVVERRLLGSTATWRLPLTEASVPRWIDDAEARLAAGDYPGARRLAKPRTAAPAPAERGLAWGVLARADIRTGDREGGVDKLRRARAAHRASGLTSEETRDGAALAFSLIYWRRFAEARAVLAALPDVPGHAESGYLAAYHRGLLAVETGDPRQGIDELRTALEQVTRVDLDSQRRWAAQVLARELQRLGHPEGGALFAALLREGDDLDPCERVELLNNVAWGYLLAREAGTAAPDAVPLLQEALALAEGDCQRLPEEPLNLRLNLALAHLQEERPEMARRSLAEAARLAVRPRGTLRIWQDEIEARLALLEGDGSGALERFAALADRARAALSPEAHWRAEIGRAAAHEALGEDAQAASSYARAETLLDREILLVPMHEGRDTFVAQREGATRRQLALLLAQRKPEAALALVHRARSRVLRSLRRFTALTQLPPAERDAWDRTIAEYRNHREAIDGAAGELWRLPADELARALADQRRELERWRGELDRLLSKLGKEGPGGPPAEPAPGELVLAYHPLPDGWVAFAADDHGVASHRFAGLGTEPTSPELLAERLLEPFADRIAAAERLRVLPYGRLREVDFHALPFAGDVLLASLPVVYSVGLPAPSAATTPIAPPRAILVGDPEGDLPGARREIAQVAAALGGSWRTTSLVGIAAEGPALRRLLPEGQLLHYAGHARFDGWWSELPLAGGGRLSLGDILSSVRSPARVVLSGCETGRVSSTTPAESPGLAQAFLAAGALSVVAAVRPLPDGEAAELVEGFYQELGRHPETAEALRRAQLALRRRAPDAGWDAFRVFVP